MRNNVKFSHVEGNKAVETRSHPEELRLVMIDVAISFLKLGYDYIEYYVYFVLVCGC